MRLFYALFALLIFLASSAVAGIPVTGTGTTAEEALWDYRFKANHAAGSKRGKDRWRSSNINEVTAAPAGGYQLYGSVPTTDGSSGKGKYDQAHVSEAAFRQKFPQPGVPATSQPPAEDPNEPKRDVAKITWLPGKPKSDRAILLIENKSKNVALVECWISARDSRDNKPERVVQYERVVLAPDGVFNHEYQSWGAVDWKLKTQ